jgi:hypothetical protein
MKLDLAKISLALSIVMFVSGFMILCDCPGWFGISALFAAFAAWKSKGRFRICSLALLAAALLIASAQLF